MVLSPRVLFILLASTASLALGCTESEEARRVAVPVQVSAAGLSETITTAEGYTVELTAMRAVLADLELTTDGESHGGSLTARLWSVIVPDAMAHPGHEAGGTVIGELPGRWLLDLTGTDALGQASMLEGDYDGANFSFGVGDVDRDAIPAPDTLNGSSVYLQGTATRDGQTVSFEAYVLQDDGRRIVGVPLTLSLSASAPVTLGLQARPVDPVEGDTLFDGIDFLALDEDGDGGLVVTPDSGEPHNRLRNALQSHDHWLLEQL